ncbi:unnamed protein product [Schistocephalus solidus]|uniref:C2H2-type domain-containing protein n=1 Tax=Schistocephalus solidus TaxID=70667 RepID=A0A183SKV1_SCHSO|nr:unnamed protein product [Schistocephalus solidus]
MTKAPTHNRDHRFDCPHDPRAFTHRKGLLGHMGIRESGIHRDANASNTSCTPINIVRSPPMSTTTRTSSTTPVTSAPTVLSCPHCHRSYALRIGLAGHLGIHRTETGEPGSGAPTLEVAASNALIDPRIHSLHEPDR